MVEILGRHRGNVWRKAADLWSPDPDTVCTDTEEILVWATFAQI